MVQWSVLGDSSTAALDAHLQSNDCTTLREAASCFTKLTNLLGLNKLYAAWSLIYTEFYM